MNSPKRNVNISNAIIESLSKYWKESGSGDFQVVVDGETFSCHSYLLESCSEFFRCLLRSGMKEKQEMRVELRNITAATFRLLLKILYDGADLLTRENVLELWQAVDLLQMPFLIEQCEQFVMANLCFHTLDNFKSQAEYLQSKKVLSFVFKFMLENFVKFTQTEVFLKLSFEELKRLIKSEELLVDSEDQVILSVFEWVTFGEVFSANNGTVDEEIANQPMDESSNYNDSGDSSQTTEKALSVSEDLTETVNPTTEEELLVSKTNEDEPNLRKKVLFELIKSTRYCLVSGRCYANLYQSYLALNDTWVKDILSQAAAYKQSCLDRGVYPSAGTHRDCSTFEHVAITSYAHRLYAFSFSKRKYFQILSIRNATKFTVCMGKLYACFIHEGATSLYEFQSNEWVGSELYGPLDILRDNVDIFIAHLNYIYLFSGNKVRRYDPIFERIVFETHAPNTESPEYALSFYERILVFSLVEGGVEETAVHSWHTCNDFDTGVWSQLCVLPFSCLNMVSFCDDVSAYILDPNGNLWKLSNSMVIEFTFLANLWLLTTTPLRGAVLFKDTLYLVADVKPQNFLTSVEGVFTDIQFLSLNETSCLVHYVIGKEELTFQ